MSTHRICMAGVTTTILHTQQVEQILMAKKMSRLRVFLIHSLNPMHVYCRLVTIGIDQETGMRLSRCYEKTVFKIVKLVIW